MKKYIIIVVIIILALPIITHLVDKEKGLDTFEKQTSSRKYKASDLVWKNDSLGADIYIKTEFLKEEAEKPEFRNSRAWLELNVKKSDGEKVTYVYYYLENYEGIRNDTLLLVDKRKETNTQVPLIASWYFLDLKTNSFGPIEYYLQESADSTEALNIKERISNVDLNSRGVFKVSEDGAVEKLNIGYEKFRLDLPDFNHDKNLYYVNISRSLYKYYDLKGIVNQIKIANLDIIAPSTIKEGHRDSFKD